MILGFRSGDFSARTLGEHVAGTHYYCQFGIESNVEHVYS